MSVPGRYCCKSHFGVASKHSGEPLIRFARGDVRDHIDLSKSITDFPSGAEKRRNGREGLKINFGEIFRVAQFRLLQQYRHADMLK